jgi:hypothetical protein
MFTSSEHSLLDSYPNQFGSAARGHIFRNPTTSVTAVVTGGDVKCTPTMGYSGLDNSQYLV